MNKTLSGITAVGAPMSPARLQAEADNALSNEDMNYSMLHLTEEGRYILQKFSSAMGSDYALMSDDTKASWLSLYESDLCSFLYGFLAAQSHSSTVEHATDNR